MSYEPQRHRRVANSPVLTPSNTGPTILPPKREALMRLSSFPSPASTANNEGGIFRLSPAQIGRRFPTAVRPLPPTSIARPSSSSLPRLRRIASRVRLRSIPALAMDVTDCGDGDDSGGDKGGSDDDNVPTVSSPTSKGEHDDPPTEGPSTCVSANATPEDPFRVNETNEVRFAISLLPILTRVSASRKRRHVGSGAAEVAQ